jgi:hypothetical protein
MPDARETCRVFDSVDVVPGALHRFVVGVDAAPRKLDDAEVAALGDAFAALLRSAAGLPSSGEAVVDGIAPALGPPRTFVLGEGSQLPMGAKVDRQMRFVVALGDGPEGPDVLVSVFHPRQQSGIEVMAWDDAAGGFNFYRSTGEPVPMWMLAGNSRDALLPASRGKGLFESHRSGSLLMKELKQPWQNWHSSNAAISARVFDDERATHPWFAHKETEGAYAFARDAASRAITRWAVRRFKAGPQPRPVLEQILDTQTANLVTSMALSSRLPAVAVDLPTTFFADVDGLVGILGLEAPPKLAVGGDAYQRCLERFGVRLEDGQGFVLEGDTFFCFLVPERAFEDQEALRLAIGTGLVSRRLAACLLMVDAWNPVFSADRAALLRHVPERATPTFSDDMAASILDAAAPGTAEAEFAELWNVGEDFAGPFSERLGRYFAAVQARLATQAGFEAYFELAEERRQRFAELPIAEFPLLLPKTNIEPAGRRMRPDGTVGA